MMNYTASEGDGLVELILQIMSPSSVFCNISVNLTGTDIEAGIIIACNVLAALPQVIIIVVVISIQQCFTAYIVWSWSTAVKL